MRRFHRSLFNLITRYIPLVHRWKVFDNYHIPPELLAFGTRRSKLGSDTIYVEHARTSRRDEPRVYRA